MIFVINCVIDLSLCNTTGRGFHSDIRRNGEVVGVIFDLNEYNYDSTASLHKLAAGRKLAAIIIF